MPRSARAIRYLLLALVLLFAPSCKRCGADRGGATQSPKRGPPVAIGPEKLALTPPREAEHRIVLDRARLAQLREQAKLASPAWRAVAARCDEAVRESIPSGYQGFDWADAVANLSLCWNATGRLAYAESALQYLNALLDDRFAVGDRKGGARVVRHDSGYGIRTFGAYTALGYDWLR